MFQSYEEVDVPACACRWLSSADRATICDGNGVMDGGWIWL
jgi:hypothetical protein